MFNLLKQCSMIYKSKIKAKYNCKNHKANRRSKAQSSRLCIEVLAYFENFNVLVIVIIIPLQITEGRDESLGQNRLLCF